MQDEAKAPPAAKKKTKLSQIDKQSDSGRRLVEYFVVISSVEQEEKEGDESGDNANVSFSDWKTESYDEEDESIFSEHKFRPVMTARYPLTDHGDNPLHDNVTFFCHPSGGIQLRLEDFMPKVHFFVATGGTGKQIYGTCLTIWEERILQSKNKDGDTAEEVHKVYLPKCLVILSTYPYLAAFREFLTQLYRLVKSDSMTLPIERYIVNFCAEMPAPPPGSFEVQTTMLDSVIKIWAPPHNLPIAWVSIPFTFLFECLDIENIILVWHCLMLERQVLITSTQLSVLTQASEIFLSLLFPMRWSHAYIPVLPTFLIPMLSAPMPFLCGINKANLADCLYDLSTECVLVDMDKNTVTLGPDTPDLPPLPPYLEAQLMAQLEENAGMIFREARSLTKHDDLSDNGTNLPSHVKMMAEAMWESKLCLFDEAFHLVFTPEEARKNHLNGNDASGLDAIDKDIASLHLVTNERTAPGRKQSNWDAVQEAFLDMFVYLLRNYRKYLVFPSKHNEGSYGGAGFRSKEFIEAQRYDMRLCLEGFASTQMFDNFITKRLYGSGEADVAFFDNAVDRFLKTAGLFADVGLGSRFLGSGQDKRANGKPGHQRKVPRTTIKVSPKINDDPLLQSAKVHRALKTIVPPEPTGEGLTPPTAEAQAATISDDQLDDQSVHSATSAGTRNSQRSNPVRLNRVGASKDTMSVYSYKDFPDELEKDMFGDPRPLSAAVIAEFDRQRKDAAQFRRRERQPKNSKNHIRKATLDPGIPTSPEAASFTLFFMAFTALVGKELMEIAHEEIADEKQILSTYVPTGNYESDTESEVMTNHSDEDTSVTMDETEKADLAEMKSARPNLGGMFGDDDLDSEQDSRKPESNPSEDAALDENSADDTAKEVVPVAEKEEGVKEKEEVDDDGTASTASKTSLTEEGKPRTRFRDKLSDSQIEEAKAKGRAQLGLAFEMLTMMKKRGLRADPEAYQSLIDACGRVGDTKRATELLGKMHEDGIVADGTVYACLVSAFSVDSAWKDSRQQEDLPEWANSTAVELDWNNKLQKRSIFDRLVGQVVDQDEEDEDEENEENMTTYQKLRRRVMKASQADGAGGSGKKLESKRMEFFVTEPVEQQITLGENLLEIVCPDISVDTENEYCTRCNFLLSDDHVVQGWTPGDHNDYTTSCPNCTQRFVPHFCVQSSSPTFMGSKGAASPLFCERLSPWVLQKEIRSVMNNFEGIDNLLDPKWREQENKNAVLWWNLVLSCMRFRFPFTFLLQGHFEQNLIAPLPEDE
jgi:pentatricopeptide repeat protein